MKLISTKETARASGWPERRIRQMVARRELRHIRVGRKILLPDSAVAEYISKNMSEPAVVGGSLTTHPIIASGKGSG